MNLTEIRSAVALGLTVHWMNSAYRVQGNSIVYNLDGPGENRVGLAPGGNLLEEPSAFFVSEHSLSFAVDDDGEECDPLSSIGEHCRYVSFGGTWVAVFSTAGGVVDEEDACELAIDLLLGKSWFAEEGQTEPDFVI